MSLNCTDFFDKKPASFLNTYYVILTLKMLISFNLIATESCKSLELYSNAVNKFQYHCVKNVHLPYKILTLLVISRCYFLLFFVFLTSLVYLRNWVEAFLHCWLSQSRLGGQWQVKWAGTPFIIKFWCSSVCFCVLGYYKWYICVLSNNELLLQWCTCGNEHRNMWASVGLTDWI